MLKRFFLLLLLAIVTTFILSCASLFLISRRSVQFYDGEKHLETEVAIVKVEDIEYTYIAQVNDISFSTSTNFIYFPVGKIELLPGKYKFGFVLETPYKGGTFKTGTLYVEKELEPGHKYLAQTFLRSPDNCDWILSTFVNRALIRLSFLGAETSFYWRIKISEIPISNFYSEDPEDWYKRGNKFFDLQWGKKAIKCYNKAIKIRPNYAEAWLGKANVCLALGGNLLALKCYNKVTELEPINAEALLGCAIVYRDFFEEYDSALKFCEKAIEIDPNNYEAWGHKGLNLFKLKRLEESLKTLEKAIEIKSNESWVWYNRGVVLSELGRYQEAEESFKKAEEIAKAEY